VWGGHLESRKNPDQLKRSIHVDRIGVHSTFVQITVSHFGEHKRLHLESSKRNYCIISFTSNHKSNSFMHGVSIVNDNKSLGSVIRATIANAK